MWILCSVFGGLPGPYGVHMSWIVLVVSGFLETVWAIALERSEGFTKLTPSLVFAGALLLSMAGLGYALKDIPVGTGYVVWTGIGAIGTAVIGMIWLGEAASVGRIICLLLVVAGVIGLKLFS